MFCGSIVIMCERFCHIIQRLITPSDVSTSFRHSRHIAPFVLCDLICFVTFSLGETLIVISINGQHLLRHMLGIHSIVIELFPSVPLRIVEDCVKRHLF